MKICIIVYSKTGHTLLVTNYLKEKLLSLNYSVDMINLNNNGVNKSFLEFNTLIFCFPVHGGLPAKPMKKYIENIESLEGKKAISLVTGIFSTNLGCNQANKFILDILKAKGASITSSESLKWWFNLNRKREILKVVESISKRIHLSEEES